MRVAGTAIICILAAFGAAFLVARAVKHGSPARAATPPRTTRVAATVTSTAGRVNAELVSQFAPVQASLKRRPKPHHRHHRKPSPQLAPVVTTASPTPAPTVTTTTPVSSAPVQSAPPPSQPSSSGSTTHKKKSSGGSGTTTIG